jgi:hypothetical protein
MTTELAFPPRQARCGALPALRILAKAPVENLMADHEALVQRPVVLLRKTDGDKVLRPSVDLDDPRDVNHQSLRHVLQGNVNRQAFEAASQNRRDRSDAAMRPPVQRFPSGNELLLRSGFLRQETTETPAALANRRRPHPS